MDLAILETVLDKKLSARYMMHRDRLILAFRINLRAPLTALA